MPVVSTAISTRYLFGWLPLKEHFKQDLAIHDYNPAGKRGIIKAYVKDVISGSYITDKNGERTVWMVTVSDEIGNGENGVSTYYFDREDRRLWQQDINAGCRKMMMKRME